MITCVCDFVIIFVSCNFVIRYKNGACRSVLLLVVQYANTMGHFTLSIMVVLSFSLIATYTRRTQIVIIYYYYTSYTKGERSDADE